MQLGTAVEPIRVLPGDENRLVVLLPYSPERVERIRSVPGRRWHPQEKHWTVPNEPGMIARLQHLFSPGPMAVDASLTAAGSGSESEGADGDGHDADLLEATDAELRLRGYSPRSRKAYRHHLRAFSTFVGAEVANASAAEIRRYLLHLVDEKQVSRAYLNQAISAIKFLYDRVLERPAVIGELPRPRRQRKLPVVLSRPEVLRLLEAVSNPKHRALLMLAYSAGLRVSEIVRLRIEDVDGDRGLIHIRGAKGGKDRYTTLAALTFEALHDYASAFRPKDWLFPGERPDRHLTSRSAQKVLRQACERAGIGKHVTVHTLRHSFATHLLEDGTDLRYVQVWSGARAACSVTAGAQPPGDHHDLHARHPERPAAHPLAARQHRRECRGFGSERGECRATGCPRIAVYSRCELEFALTGGSRG